MDDRGLTRDRLVDTYDAVPGGAEFHRPVFDFDQPDAEDFVPGRIQAGGLQIDCDDLEVAAITVLVRERGRQIVRQWPWGCLGQRPLALVLFSEELENTDSNPVYRRRSA